MRTNTTDEGFSFSFHKNYKLGPTYPPLVIFSLRELNQTSPLVCFLGLTKFSVPIWSPWEPNLSHRRRGLPAWPVINQLCFPERHFSANCISLRLGEVQMKFYETSLQALLSSAPHGFAARSRLLVRLASLAQIGELACRLVLLLNIIQLCECYARCDWSLSMSC